MERENLKKIKDYTYEIPASYRKGMRVPARVYASEETLDIILGDKSLDQLVNVSTLPGIVWRALAMPDAHQGYGFPIGGVAALDLTKGGVISPGGVGFDINCGVRILTTPFQVDGIQNKLADLATQIQRDVPSGVGRGGEIKVSRNQLNQVLNKGSKYIVSQGYGQEDDLEATEEGGCFKPAKAEAVSEKAQNRGRDQLGTLGSGNHFLELQEVKKILDNKTAEVFGLKKGQLVVMIHCGSRGLGHQVATDYTNRTLSALQKKKVKLPDKELAYAPFRSNLGQDYFAAMAAACNYAWANRQVIAFRVRRAFDQIFGQGEGKKVKMLYDVAHNIAKIEKHKVAGEKRKLCVHRKGATRSFGPGREEIPEKYRKVGQPVLIPGSMGTSSWVLRGASEAEEKSFASTCHGAGRRMSRTKARKKIQGSALKNQLKQKGIIVCATSMKGLAEEGSYAYKDINNVVDVVDKVGLAKRVAQLVPLAVVKG